MSGRVTLKACVNLSKRCQFSNIEVSGTSQYGIENGRDMSVAQEEEVFTLAVHVPACWVNCHLTEIKTHQEIGAA